jgi:cbb3-type cytochrome oxidase subunit 3
MLLFLMFLIIFSAVPYYVAYAAHACAHRRTSAQCIFDFNNENQIYLSQSLNCADRRLAAQAA